MVTWPWGIGPTSISNSVAKHQRRSCIPGGGDCILGGDRPTGEPHPGRIPTRAPIGGLLAGGWPIIPGVGAPRPLGKGGPLGAGLEPLRCCVLRQLQSCDGASSLRSHHLLGWSNNPMNWASRFCRNISWDSSASHPANLWAPCSSSNGYSGTASALRSSPLYCQGYQVFT